MAFESTRIITALLASSAVLATIDTFTDENDDTQYCIFYNSVLPDWITEQKTINFYRTSPIFGNIEYGLESYTINCRAETFQDAESIQNAVYTALNRELTTSTTDGLFYCSALPIISPADSTDNYNAPIEVQIKYR